MSLRFVTRKLKTQTLGDDDADVEIENTGVDQPGAANQNREKTEDNDGSERKCVVDPKEKPASVSISTSRSRRVLRQRPHSCEDSESEDDDVRDREPSRIERASERREFALPNSNTCLPHPHHKGSASVFDAPSAGTQPPTTSSFSSGMIPKSRPNHTFSAISSDTTMMLEDNYSSEEELKEIISSEKQRKRSGGGSVKDGKSQHRGAARDSQYNEHGERRKSSVKRGSLGAETMVTCQSISDSLSPSPSSGKMALPGSRPSSARTCKVARATPSGASSNAAEKRKWSEVEYAEYCCKNSECTNADARSDIQKYSGNGKKTLVATGNNAPSPGSNTRCRASGTISAPPVPAVLMVRGSGSVNSGAHCSTRWDSISRSGSSGCSSQHSCCGDDEDAYIGGDGGCCNLRSTPRLHNVSRGSSAGGSGIHGGRHTDVPTPVQFCTSPPLDVHRPTRNHGTARSTDNDSTQIQSDAIAMPRKTEKEYEGETGSLFATSNDVLSSGPSSSSPPPSKLFHFDDENRDDKLSGNAMARCKPIPISGKGKPFQTVHFTGKDIGESSEKDADEEVENMMENSKPFQNFEFISMDQAKDGGSCSNRNAYSDVIDDMTAHCNKLLPSKISRGKEGQRCSRGFSLRSSCKMKADAKLPSTLRRRSHSQSRIPTQVHHHLQEYPGFYHTQHTHRGVGHLHRRRQTPSPSKRHRLTPRPPTHSSNSQRPSLDFEKMQQIKKRVITSWRPQGTELSLFCW